LYIEQDIALKLEALYTIVQILTNAEQLSWRYDLYIEDTQEITPSTPVAVIDADKYDDPEDIPFAQDNNLRYALTISTTQDIIRNAHLQRPEASTSDLIQAFQYYLENDAFIDLQTNP
jgi:hypothetical protein